MNAIPPLSTLTSEQKDDLILRLLARVLELEARIVELEARLAKDSHNSSKPPSSDGYGKKKTTSLRKPSGKPPGGQKGHKGNTLERTSEPDEIRDCPLPASCSCGLPLDASRAEVAEQRQVFDVPIQPFQVIEHRTLKLACSCGQVHVSQFPADVVAPVQYGPNIRALGVHLTQFQLLPYARAAQLLRDLFLIDVSPATIAGWVSFAGQALAPTVTQIGDHLTMVPVAHADESGFRVEGSLHWLHTVVSESLTWYGVHKRRGMEAIVAQGILPKRVAVLIHDCWAPYWQLDCVHALCGCHLLRELVFAHETTGQIWAQNMIDLLTTANAACVSARELGHKTLTDEQIEHYRLVYQALVDGGSAVNPEATRASGKRGKVKQTSTFNLLCRLREYKDDVLRFTTDLSIPFTNNLAERAIRMPKVKQKISGCFRSANGANNFAIIRSYLDTMHKQGCDLLDTLRLTFLGTPPQPAMG